MILKVAFVACVVECAVAALSTAMVGTSAVLSGSLDLSSPSVGTATGTQIFSGHVSNGWNWVGVVNISAVWSDLSWEYTSTKSGTVETVLEVDAPALGGSPFGTCLAFVAACWCTSHSYLGSNVLISLSAYENFNKYNVSTSTVPWTMELTISSPSFTNTFLFNTSVTEISGAHGVNISTVAALSSDCFKDISGTHFMTASTDPANATQNYFIENVYFGDQHNRLGYTGNSWATDYDPVGCNQFKGFLTAIPESTTQLESYYIPFGGVGHYRTDQMYMWKSGRFPSGLIHAISPTNPGSCEIVSHVLVGDGSQTQKHTVFGSSPGTLNFDIHLPLHLFFELVTVDPTTTPSFSPSDHPTAQPSFSPSTGPSGTPTSPPSVTPTTTTPSHSPSQSPIQSPTLSPSNSPTGHPVTRDPTSSPTLPRPSWHPTLSPSLNPSFSPSSQPTHHPALMYSAETYGSFFVTGVSVSSILANHVSNIEASVASVLNVSASRVVVDLVTASTRRRLKSRGLLSQTSRVHFTVKGYVETIGFVKTQLQTPSVLTRITLVLSANIPDANVFDLSLDTDTCPSGEQQFNNGLQTLCVSSCAIDEEWSTSGCLRAHEITYAKSVTIVNHVGRALYTLLGAFAWGFVLMVVSIARRLSQR